MTRFVVPKFIEHKLKVIGPLNFYQFAIMAVAGMIVVALKFLLPSQIFLIAAVAVAGGALALAFVKIGPYSLPTLLKNFFMFSLSPRLYIWRKKTTFPKIIKEQKVEKQEKAEKMPELKIAEKSQLKKLSTQIETSKK